MEAAVVGLTSTVLGALISSVAGWMSNKRQYRMEGQKLADEQQKERREQLREKREEAHQLLSKIRTETTPQASHRMRSTEATLYPEQYQESHDDVRRLLMIADLYFPQLQEPVKALEGLTIGFWNNHETVMSLEGVETEPGIMHSMNSPKPHGRSALKSWRRRISSEK
jgi:hypothetical protein